jgi:hypothetical protein
MILQLTLSHKSFKELLRKPYRFSTFYSLSKKVELATFLLKEQITIILTFRYSY